MKTALVLSGGGANGAFQAGALATLTDRGIEFDAISGVSVGSLNGALVAQDDIDALVRVWHSVSERDVYIRKSLAQIAWRLLVQKKRSVYDAEPLWDLIEEYIHLERMARSYYVGFTALEDGQYHCLKHTDFDNSDNLRRAIYASSLMPIIWEPVDKIRTKYNELYFESCDGGLCDVTPLSCMLQEAPDRIVIIQCNDGQVEPQSKQKSIIGIVKRVVLDVMLNEIVRNDVEGLLRINDLVLQATLGGVELKSKSGRVYKYFRTDVIAPTEKLGSPIDFSRDKLDRCFKMGQIMALLVKP